MTAMTREEFYEMIRAWFASRGMVGWEVIVVSAHNRDGCMGSLTIPPVSAPTLPPVAVNRPILRPVPEAV